MPRSPDRDELRWWTLPIVDVAKAHQGVHVVFNTNHANYATTNALEMGELSIGAGFESAPRADCGRP